MVKMGLKDVRHLSVRTGLGIRWNNVKRYRGKTRKDSVQHIIRSSKNNWILQPPAFIEWQPWSPTQTPQQRKQQGVLLAQDKRMLKQWAVKMLLRTPHPLTERMVLFWHNHFTSSLDKINQPALLLKQNITFRRHSLGNFKQLLHSVARDPAMLIYLDNDTNKKGQPNENFARELLELFTLGEGHFSEKDVRGAAQAFTGWTADRQKKQFVFQRNTHDTSIKSFMGKKGRFNGEHIIDMLLKNPYTAEHIATKFWAEFVSDERPNPVTIRRWGNIFRRADYDIQTLLSTVLNSREFWSAQHRGGRIKSPVELIVGTLRTLILTPPSDEKIVRLFDRLGQKLFTPDTPEGYSGGQQWIDTYTLPTRVNLMSAFINNAKQHDLARIPQLAPDIKTSWLLAQKSVNPLSNQDLSHKHVLHALLTDPAYQLT